MSGKINGTVYVGNNLDFLRTLPSNSVDSVVTDPPYGLGKEPDVRLVLRDWLIKDEFKAGGAGFLGREWDAFVPSPVLWMECLRVLKPGGHLLSFAGTRTYDWIVLGVRLAGFEIRDMVSWIYGCLDEETNVVTANGPKSYKEVQEGDLVLCYDRDRREYSFQPILEIVEYDYKDTAYRLVLDDGREQFVTRGHRCIVERNGAETFVLAESLSEFETVPIVEAVSDLLKAVHGGGQKSGAKKADLQQRLHEDSGRQYVEGAAVEAVGGAESGGSEMHKLRGGDSSASCLDSEHAKSSLQYEMQRDYSAEDQPCKQPVAGSSVVEGGVEGVSFDASERREQCAVEGRRGDQREPAARHQDEVCSLPQDAFGDGSSGWVHHAASPSGVDCGRSAVGEEGDGEASQRGSSGQSDCESRPVQGLFASAGVRMWSGQKPSVVRVVPTEYEGKVWCLRVPTGAFVAERKGLCFPTGNSGFPKGNNISKAIDDLYGATRTVIGTKTSGIGSGFQQQNGVFAETLTQAYEVGAPKSMEAKFWDGWNTNLKPACEPVVVARKPMAMDNIAENVLEYGTGGINIDACRIDSGDGYEKAWDIKVDKKENMAVGYAGHGTERPENGEKIDISAYRPSGGRWPANIIHDGSDEVLEIFPSSKDGVAVNRNKEDGVRPESHTFAMPQKSGPDLGYGGEGSNARFFYSAKAAQSERHAGLDEIREYGANVHPTVKPIGLMRYLVRLVTPAGGTVLDPFAGSGTTLVAAQIEGCRWIGMELETNHGLICYLRAKHWAENPPDDAKPLGVPYKKPAPTKKKIVLKTPQDASVSVGARFRKPHSSDFFGKSRALNEKDGIENKDEE
jgi:site-specific DNA-methyltransferase (adenine-specific)